MSEWTTVKLLDIIVGHLKKAGIENTRLKVEMLMSHFLGLQRIQLYIDSPVPENKLGALREAVRQASTDKPVEYIIGRTTFYSIELKVGRGCLIPRSETEDLVKAGVDFLRACKRETKSLDLCCGNGCIPIAMAKNVPEARFTATDISADALEIAEKNIEFHKLAERISLRSGDMFAALEAPERFDLITCNPPYISPDEYETLHKNVKAFEPAVALVAEDNGLAYYKTLAAQAKDYMHADSLMLLEIGYNQGKEVAEIFNNNGYETEILADFAGNQRIASVRLTG
jgi:release factor glutamine methyltransferase